jgi:hypothetical protein
MCIIYHVIVVDVTSTKEADFQKYALRSTNTTWPKFFTRNQNEPNMRTCEEGHKTCWKEAEVLQIEPNTTHRKYKESAHMSLVDHPISQPSLDISPIWTPLMVAEIRKLRLRPV